MNRENAKAISELMVSIGERADDVLRRVRETEPEAEQRRAARMISNVLMTMLTEVMNPLYEEHPDLRPKELA